MTMKTTELKVESCEYGNMVIQNYSTLPVNGESSLIMTGL
jgi:hypothetical protein